MTNEKKKLVPWKIKDIIFVFLSIIFLTVFVRFIFSVTGFKDIYEESDYKSFWMLNIYLVQSLIIFIPLILFTFIKYGSKIRDFGFNKVKIGKAIVIVVITYIGYLLFNFLFYQISDYFGVNIPGFSEQEPILPMFGNDNFSVIISFFIIVVIAPLIEEMFFRGFVLQILLKEVSGIYASFITALIFAAVHFEPQSMLPILILGLILNWLFLKFKSILPCILFHALNNFLTLLVLYSL